MVDTMRTLASLQSLLADNTSGQISPQDLRDMLITLSPPYGSFYLSTPAETTISSSGTYVKMAGTTAENNVRDFTHSTGRLTYTGAEQQHFHIATHIDFTTASNNQVISFQLAKNGTVIAESKTQRKTGTGSDVGALSLHWDEMLDTNDYIEMFVTNDTTASNMTAQHFYMFCLGMIV